MKLPSAIGFGFSAIGAAAMLVCGVAQAALQDRDLNGDMVVDAFYDTDLNVTWLRDANVNGLMDWDTAVTWADSYSFGAYSDWRLPTSDQCQGLNCAGSEMGHLWYVELGNSAGVPMTNTGDFQNLLASFYSGTESVPYSNTVLTFHTSIGYQIVNPKFSLYQAMAVRNGDVAVVPEPEGYALALAGLGVVVLARRRS